MSYPRIKMLTVLLMLGIASSGSVTTEDVLSVHVDAVHGSDANSGSSAADALRTTTAARDAVRELRSAGHVAAVQVLLHPGAYEHAAPLAFDARDSGHGPAGNTTWRAADPAAAAAVGHVQQQGAATATATATATAADTNLPRLLGGVILGSGGHNISWQQSGTTPAPPGGGATHAVWRAALPPALLAQLAHVDGEQIPSLFVGGVRMWRARWPNADAAHPTIWGGGYATASGGLGRLPCAFRSPDITQVGPGRGPPPPRPTSILVLLPRHSTYSRLTPYMYLTCYFPPPHSLTYLLSCRWGRPTPTPTDPARCPPTAATQRSRRPGSRWPRTHSRLGAPRPGTT